LMDDCNSKDRGQDVPEMRGIHDLEEKEVNFYMELFEGSESVLYDAANKKNEFAMYTERAQDPYSMPDRCRVACQNQLRAFEEVFKNGAKPTCVADDLKKTFDCLDRVETGDGKSCQFHNWATSFRHICGGEDDDEDVFASTTNTPNATARVLDDDVDDDRGDDSHNVLLEEPLLVSNNSETADQRRLAGGSLVKNLWGAARSPSCVSDFMIPFPVNIFGVVNWWLPDFWIPGGGKFKSYVPNEWKYVKTWWRASNKKSAQTYSPEAWKRFETDAKYDPFNWGWKHDFKKECKKTKNWWMPWSCKWVKTGKKTWALKDDLWEDFRLGDITWPWCASMQASGDHPRHFIIPSNWGTPFQKGKSALEFSQEYLMDEVAKREERRKPAHKRKKIASPLPATRQDVQSHGTGDKNNPCEEWHACRMINKEFGFGRSCQASWGWCIVCYACRAKEMIKKIAAYLKPLIALVKQGVGKVAEILGNLALEHVMEAFTMQIESTYSLEFTLLWGKTKNPFDQSNQRFYIQIQIRACVALEVIFPPIKPPIMVDACFEGTLRLITGSSCPGIKTIMIGRSTITVDVGFDFWFASFSLASVQLGIECGIDRHTPMWCWWYHNPAWGWNLSWWQIRRRRIHKCAWGKEVCSVYVKGWISIRVWIAKVIVEFCWWMSSGNIDIWLYFKVETIWSLYWEWKQIWGKKSLHN